jgi:hypothetical protein
MATQEEIRAQNRMCMEKLASNDPVLVKQALDVVNDFTRTKMREEGFLRKIMPPITITDDDLDRRADSEEPLKVVDIEPDSPGSISVGFNTLPQTLFMDANRYEVRFHRVVTPKFTKDVSLLRTWYMDLRQVLSDNAIKDMLAEEDGKFLRAINTILVGERIVCPTSGTVQYEVINGGITRNSWADSLKVLPNTPSNLEVHTVLMNNITVKDLMKWQRNELGGDVAEDIVKNGFSLKELFGKTLLITIKKGLVATGTTYHFADPKFIGKFYELERPTMFIKREAWNVEFFSYEEIGAGIGHASSVARIDFR